MAVDCTSFDGGYWDLYARHVMKCLQDGIANSTCNNDPDGEQCCENIRASAVAQHQNCFESPGFGSLCDASDTPEGLYCFLTAAIGGNGAAQDVCEIMRQELSIINNDCPDVLNTGILQVDAFIYLVLNFPAGAADACEAVYPTWENGIDLLNTIFGSF